MTGSAVFDWLDDSELRRLQRRDRLYEALARAECRRQGIDPDDVIADGGHLAWHLVGYEAALLELVRSGGDRSRLAA